MKPMRSLLKKNWISSLLLIVILILAYIAFSREGWRLVYDGINQWNHYLSTGDPTSDSCFFNSWADSSSGKKRIYYSLVGKGFRHQRDSSGLPGRWSDPRRTLRLLPYRWRPLILWGRTGSPGCFCDRKEPLVSIQASLMNLPSLDQASLFARYLITFLIPPLLGILGRMDLRRIYSKNPGECERMNSSTIILWIIALVLFLFSWKKGQIQSRREL